MYVASLQRIFFGNIHAADLVELNQFAFDHFLRQINQDIEHMEIAFFQRDLERLHVQPIACQDAAMIAPAGIGGGAAAARIGAVNHIVMDQRSAVEQLHHRGQI